MHSRSASSVVPVPTILLVDDTPSSLQLLQEALQQQGYQVAIAQTGQEALTFITNAPPDLILLDVVMPGMDGYEVTRQIHQNTALPFIPIVLITAYDYSLMEVFEAGAIDIVEKSNSLDELVARVESLLALKQIWNDQIQTSQEQASMMVGLTHDLRTPIVAANQMLEQIQVGDFGNTLLDLQPPLAQLISNNQAMLNIVETALETYQYDTQDKALAFFPVDLVELSREVLAELRSLATQKGIELRLVNAGFVEARGDRLELHRLLTNLVSNAIRFTDVGFVEIRLRRVLIDQADWAVIEVIDTGTGISETQQEQLFRRFTPGQSSQSGNGLGLYLCQQIVTAHQGRIEVQSILSEGTTFTIQIPAIR
ncbi:MULTISPECIES: hybrid sensor histidine kinase/response regulator [Leptolyngbya]|uniref:hybrid sensor histidine kinase/response regulator n=1 Tax=Leptolyngbya TaxID=47251 RepID=UPI001688CC91|nr:MULTISPECIES: hybrid sensor histidine kinase/response regulator [unclassified Leptolyngbya]MBD1855531.1 hybrid sensor histidine kinase/response regulator [Leptolyngbya sp. FACHB-1624]MBN8563572.1 hybrid sensor histidine kinase/response regulator [Leptolyngbya sp. UWPOB_LEPTO1]